ncbi:MAG: hypothetical protein OEY14_01515, partial [Myxococcales bacterium]|nr:hypothetical protein [Myxococcales bacterium]
SVTIDASALNDGDSCVLRLINADGTYVDHSLLGLTGASVNFSGFSPGEPMTTPRRGLSLVMGEATRAARFLYAIGGDDGSEAGAYATSESASVDLFGAPSAWMAQPIGLPGPLTRAQALRLDRFIYLIGGHDSTSATSDAWRAEILDPRDAPVVEDLTARRGMGSGLNPGIWYYRISAVMDAADPRNPGGETLPSDPLVINLPSTVPDTVLITLYWSEVVGATAYRIYRSPDPDLSAGSERLLAEIPATSAREFEDDGSAPGAELPLPLGAHGEWAALPPLNTARAGLGLGHAVDPADPSLHHLYAIGGEDDGGALLSSYEYLTITITSPKDHALGAGWTLGAIDIGAARTDLGVYSVDHDTAGAVAMGETFIYAVAGADAGGGVSDQGAALVVAGGELENPSAPAATSFLALGNAPARAGFAHIAGSHALYMIAGGPSATNNSNRAEICAPGVPGCAGGPPEIVNWNNEGGARPNPGRYLLGSVRDGSFVFIAGGVDTAGTVVDTTEQSVL